jgi:hypothetical protein
LCTLNHGDSQWRFSAKKLKTAGHDTGSMIIISRFYVAILTAGLALLLGGCGAGQQSRSMEFNDSLLINLATLEKCTGYEVL